MPGRGRTPIKFARCPFHLRVYPLSRVPTLKENDKGDTDRQETIEKAIEYILKNYKEKRNFLLMPIRDYEVKSTLKEWRERFFQDVFGVKAIALKAYKTGAGNRYNDILDRELLKRSLNYTRELQKLEAEYDNFTENMFNVPGTQNPTLEVKKFLRSGVDKAYEDFFRFFEDEFKRQVDIRINHRDKILHFVCQYALACFRRKQLDNIRFNQGKMLQTRTEKQVEEGFEAISEELNEIMKQRGFDRYEHTPFLQEANEWEQTIVDFLNRMTLIIYWSNKTFNHCV